MRTTNLFFIVFCVVDLATSCSYQDRKRYRKARRSIPTTQDNVESDFESITVSSSQRPPEDKNVNGACGPSRGTCASGICCSAEGWCGTGIDYCRAPDCQLDFGPGCDGNRRPRGESTSSVPRTHSNPDITYGGVGLTSCNLPGTVALTFDDGPYNYTNHILDLLDSYDAKATFFITGNNIGKGQIDDPTTQWPAIIRRMHHGNHQIASHTWSHQDLAAISTEQLHQQIYYNEMAFRNILGFFPQYMRPPFSSCNTACEQFLEQAGYHVIYFDLDSEDYLNDDPNLIQHAKNDINSNFSTIANPNWLIIEHDIHYQTAYNLTEYTLQQIKARGLKAVTVGECMGDDRANWYRSDQDKYMVSQDGKCGSAAKSVCTGSSFGSCCSQSNWCGSTDAYCGQGCQSSWGGCGGTRVDKNHTLGISTDGTCGSNSGYSCLNSAFGPCCSNSGWCGSDQSYCSNGCQQGFGKCSN